MLIVDDDPEVLSALAFMAGTRGYEVRRCASGTQALAADLSDVGCLVIDQRLPDTQGLDLLAELRRRGALAPAILITSDPSAAVRRRAEDEGVPLVEKPLLDDRLATELDRARPAR